MKFIAKSASQKNETEIKKEKEKEKHEQTDKIKQNGERKRRFGKPGRTSTYRYFIILRD